MELLLQCMLSKMKVYSWCRDSSSQYFMVSPKFNFGVWKLCVCTHRCGGKEIWLGGLPSTRACIVVNLPIMVKQSSFVEKNHIIIFAFKRKNELRESKSSPRPIDGRTKTWKQVGLLSKFTTLSCFTSSSPRMFQAASSLSSVVLSLHSQVSERLQWKKALNIHVMGQQVHEVEFLGY